jgi:hypothetical protein
MTTLPASRDDLPFTARAASGEREPWQPARCPESYDTAAAHGRAALASVAQLARTDEYEAYAALAEALTAASWNPVGGEEAGFADAVARLALVGLRAQRERAALPFEPVFDAARAHWFSLNTRVELMEAQLKALKLTPWRSYADMDAKPARRGD